MLVKGDVSNAQGVLTRVHSVCLTGDVLGSMRCDCGPQLHEALATLAREDRAILIYVRDHEGRGIGITQKVRAYALQQQHALDTYEVRHTVNCHGTRVAGGHLYSHDIKLRIFIFRERNMTVPALLLNVNSFPISLPLFFPLYSLFLSLSLSPSFSSLSHLALASSLFLSFSLCPSISLFPFSMSISLPFWLSISLSPPFPPCVSLAISVYHRPTMRLVCRTTAATTPR